METAIRKNETNRKAKRIGMNWRTRNIVVFSDTKRVPQSTTNSLKAWVKKGLLLLWKKGAEREKVQSIWHTKSDFVRREQKNAQARLILQQLLHKPPSLLQTKLLSTCLKKLPLPRLRRSPRLLLPPRVDVERKLVCTLWQAQQTRVACRSALARVLTNTHAHTLKHARLDHTRTQLLTVHL